MIDLRKAILPGQCLYRLTDPFSPLNDAAAFFIEIAQLRNQKLASLGYVLRAGIFSVRHRTPRSLGEFPRLLDGQDAIAANGEGAAGGAILLTAG